jgi:hypothetical protein
MRAGLEMSISSVGMSIRTLEYLSMLSQAADGLPSGSLAAWAGDMSPGAIQADGAEPGVSWVRQAVSLTGSMPGSRPSWRASAVYQISYIQMSG